MYRSPSYSNVLRFQACHVSDGQRMCGRTDSQQVHHHQLAVIVPPVLEKSEFRLPAVGQQSCVRRQPGPVHTVKDLSREPGDLAMRKCAGRSALRTAGSLYRWTISRNPKFVHHVRTSAQ